MTSEYVSSTGDQAVSGIDRAPTKLLKETAELLANKAQNTAIEVADRADSVASVSMFSSIAVMLLALIGSYMLLSNCFARPIRQMVQEVAH